jgi:short-subunit dehydrogenase
MGIKTVVITGASSGIGEALAYQYAQLKYNVVIAARSLEQLKLVELKCNEFTPSVLVVQCDVSKESDCQFLIEETIRQFSSCDVLINNAGISMRAVFNDCDIEVIKKVMDVNFWGAVYCTKYALPFLLKSQGTVVGVSSIAGIKGLPARTGYSASKFAMHGFLESLRIENLKNNLNVLIVCPGYTASNIRNAALNNKGSNQTESPLDEAKLMSAEEVAQRIIKAINLRKSYVYMSFEGKMLFWINKFFPLLMDKIVFNKVSKEKDSPFK